MPHLSHHPTFSPNEEELHGQVFAIAPLHVFRTLTEKTHTLDIFTSLQQIGYILLFVGLGLWKNRFLHISCIYEEPHQQTNNTQ